MATKEKNLTADDFDKLLFEEFHVLRPVGPEAGESSDCGDDQGAEIQLIEVDRHHLLRHLEGGEFHPDRKRDPFTLLFRGSHRHVYVSHIHTLAHKQLGTIEVFLNPVHEDPIHPVESHPRGRFYEVYFN